MSDIKYYIRVYCSSEILSSSLFYNIGNTYNSVNSYSIIMVSKKVCAVSNCKAYGISSPSTISFHKFPKDLNRNMWTQHVLDLSKIYSICSIHFTKDNYMTNTSRPMLRYGSVPSINLPSTAFLKSLSLKINKETTLKKTPTKCSPMHMFKKFGSFVHSLKRQTSNIFTVDKEIHDATTLSDELTGIKKLNRSLFGSDCLNNIDETPNVFFTKLLIINNMLGSVIQKEATEKKGQRFEETEKSFALGLYYHSPAAYCFMKSFLCLPDIRSLRRWLEGLDVSCGINQNILNILKLKFQTAPIREKLVSIIVDEMSLKQLITFNSQNDTFYGYEDFGSDIFEDLKTLKQGNQVLVVMVKSLILSWKQILGFFIVNGSVTGDRLKCIVEYTITKLNECGLIPKVIICDQGSNNLKMRKLFNVTKEKPYITFNNENLKQHIQPNLLNFLMTCLIVKINNKRELNEKYGIEYLLMRRLTQDCIESLFSVLRAKGGNNLTPDASKIQSAIRMNMCNMLISPSNNANCEKDASEFLALTKDIKTSTITLDRPYNESEEIYNIDDYYSSMNIEYILMNGETANSVAYVTGWVCSQLDHRPCIEKLATKNKDANTKFDLDNTHIAIKEYEDCSLLYPLVKTLEFTKHVSVLFHANIENLILKKKNIITKS
ncbi:hypothetical protein AGLY_017059 [Aphis glycines]|uniref:THAP-type domain-containing protein n=1 Tax=Aphis glycines TaxID=307491 RepID=A0A6G0SWL1_APHGL|nr:hypothetical protein AGLY_017059 [Aphis glycines]